MTAVSRTPLILLPPSEAKTPGGRGAPWTPGRMRIDALDDERLTVANALSDALIERTVEPAELFGVAGENLDRAIAVNTSLLTSGTTTAMRRYSGVLFGELDVAGLDTTAKRRLSRQVLIVSGLFGLVAPSDPLPDYKLKMGSTLPRIGRLATWWKPRLTAALAPEIHRRVVWDLLPGEHAAAWAPDNASMRHRIRVRFLDNVGTTRTPKYSTVSHWNKLLKGALVRYLLGAQLAEPEGLGDFEHPLGYRYDPSLTTTKAGVTDVCLVR